MSGHQVDSSKARCLILFAREPVLGRVKTRLEPALGDEGCLALYRQLLKQQITLVNNFPEAEVQLWVDGKLDHPDFEAFTGLCFQQEGKDLGERMSHALQHALMTSAAAVLIGCDCPEFSAAYLDRAFKALEQGADVVLGPAADGGYVLVGLQEGREEIFRDIQWGSAKVMEQTRRRIEKINLRCEEMEVLHDIDEPADLVFLNMSEQS